MGGARVGAIARVRGFVGKGGDPRYVGGRSRWWGVGRGDRDGGGIVGQGGDPRYWL